jgi:hypothetical protein
MDSGKITGWPKNPASRKPVIEDIVTLVVTVTFEPDVQLPALSVTDTGSPEREGAAANATALTSSDESL